VLTRVTYRGADRLALQLLFYEPRDLDVLYVGGQLDVFEEALHLAGLRD
jgi:hypothetical protein